MTFVTFFFYIFLKKDFPYYLVRNYNLLKCDKTVVEDELMFSFQRMDLSEALIERLKRYNLFTIEPIGEKIKYWKEYYGY